MVIVDMDQCFPTPSEVKSDFPKGEDKYRIIVQLQNKTINTNIINNINSLI